MTDYEEILKLINDVKEKIKLRYQAVVMAAKRAKQLQRGAKPVIESIFRKPTTIALDELRRGYIQIQTEDEITEIPEIPQLPDSTMELPYEIKLPFLETEEGPPEEGK